MSVVLLLRAVQSNQSQIDACLQKLIIVDPMRKNYYLDLSNVAILNVSFCIHYMLDSVMGYFVREDGVIN